MKDACLIKSVVLVIGTMGSGKTTLSDGLRALGAWFAMKVLDTDECRAPVYEPKLRELRRSQAWGPHNELWYPQIWGGLMARIGLLVRLTSSWAPIYVVDHGGSFITELKQFKVLRGVVALHQPEEVARERVLKREEAKGKQGEPELVRLVKSNTQHIASQVEWLLDHGVDVRQVDTATHPAPEVLEAVLDHFREWDALLRSTLQSRSRS